MSRRVSLNARLAQDAESSAEIEIVLLHITHPDMDGAIRLSTDNTERLSEDPVMYCTRSTWMGSNPVTEPFYFVLASAVVPSDLEDAAGAGRIVLENVDNDIAKLLRSFITPATVNVAVVLASSPNLLEAEFTGHNLVSADINASDVTLQFSREDIEDERVPADRMSKDRFPGLHR